MTTWTWLILPLSAALYCAARSFADFRARRFVWAILGLLSAAALLLMPIPTHSVVVNLPLGNGRAPTPN